MKPTPERIPIIRKIGHEVLIKVLDHISQGEITREEGAWILEHTAQAMAETNRVFEASGFGKFISEHNEKEKAKVQ